MTYSDLVTWIETWFPGADYNLQVSTARKHGIDAKVTEWLCYVWPRYQTIRVEGHSAEQIRAALEAKLSPPRQHQLDLVDPDKVSA